MTAIWNKNQYQYNNINNTTTTSNLNYQDQDSKDSKNYSYIYNNGQEYINKNRNEYSENDDEQEDEYVKIFLNQNSNRKKEPDTRCNVLQYQESKFQNNNVTDLLINNHNKKKEYSPKILANIFEGIYTKLETTYENVNFSDLENILHEILLYSEIFENFGAKDQLITLLRMLSEKLDLIIFYMSLYSDNPEKKMNHYYDLFLQCLYSVIQTTHQRNLPYISHYYLKWLRYFILTVLSQHYEYEQDGKNMSKQHNIINYIDLDLWLTTQIEEIMKTGYPIELDENKRQYELSTLLNNLDKSDKSLIRSYIFGLSETYDLRENIFLQNIIMNLWKFVIKNRWMNLDELQKIALYLNKEDGLYITSRFIEPLLYLNMIN
jgi:hypothetical protein